MAEVPREPPQCTPLTSTVNAPAAEVDLPIKTGDYIRTEVELEIKGPNRTQKLAVLSLLRATRP